jgi:hypothetical protein
MLCIGRACYCSAFETHVRNVLSKLQMSNRQEAIVFVLKHGLRHKFRGKITDFRDDNRP